jgi:hypothetical protein
MCMDCWVMCTVASTNWYVQFYILQMDDVLCFGSALNSTCSRLCGVSGVLCCIGETFSCSECGLFLANTFILHYGVRWIQHIANVWWTVCCVGDMGLEFIIYPEYWVVEFSVDPFNLRSLLPAVSYECSCDVRPATSQSLLPIVSRCIDSVDFKTRLVPHAV